MTDEAPANKTRETTTALVNGAVASAVQAGKDQGLAETQRYHAPPPTEQSLQAMRDLLEMETLDATVQIMMPIMHTIGVVIERTAMREQTRLGGDGLFVSKHGIAQALTMSLSDFVIALGEVGGIETHDADRIAELIEEDRDRNDAKAGLERRASATTAEKHKLILP